MTEESPALLYHYCDLKGLRGMIEKKCLWMTSVHWMDDTSEMFWLYEVVERVIEEKPNESRNELHAQLKKRMKDRRLSHIYCACFSKEPDSLSQRLEYADEGHGFSIGFNRAAFELKRDPPMRDLELSPVTYDDTEQQEIAKEVIGQLQERREDIDAIFFLSLAIISGGKRQNARIQSSRMNRSGD